MLKVRPIVTRKFSAGNNIAKTRAENIILLDFFPWENEQKKLIGQT